MQLLSPFLSFLPLPFLATAHPALPSPSSAVIPTGPTYRLKTVVINGGSPSKDNLYVSSYHIGAGLNDVVLVPGNSSYGSTGFLNETYQEFDLGTEFPWGFYMGGDANYARWEIVQMNGGLGDQGFYSNDTDGSGMKGLKWNIDYPRTDPGQNNEFQGWLVCDWYHGLPQLFWLTYEAIGSERSYPCSCAQVELHRVCL